MKFLFLIFIMIAVSGCGNISSTSPDTVAKGVTVSGNDIVTEHLRRDSSPYRKDRVRFTIESPGEPVEIYEIDVARRQKDGETSTMSTIVKPAEDAGSGSLTIETPDKPTVNVTYAASRSEFRETDTGKMFFGGLTVQELLGEWKKYDFTLLGNAETMGRSAFEVEGKLKPGERSAIATLKVLFDKENYLPIELHLYDNNGKALRTYRHADIKEASGRAYVARTEVENHIYNSRITIEILNRDYPANMDDGVFSRERLKTGVRK